MNDVWAKGDLAECICADWFVAHKAPQRGDIFRVDRVLTIPFLGLTVPMIGFESIPTYCWQASAFRKIEPKIIPASKLWAAWLRRQLEASQIEAVT